MLGLARAAKRRLFGAITERRERALLAPLYAPDPASDDLPRHMHEAIEWLKRAQDAGTDRGVAYGVRFGEGFDVSYPETTGYICETFLEHERLTGDQDLLRRAIEMGDWEIEIQLDSGAVMGGKYNSTPTPAVFNTGMVLLGWAALIERTREQRFADAATRACEWLLSVQEPNGNWVRGNSEYGPKTSTLYNAKAALGMCKVGVAIGDQRFIDAAVRNGEYCLSRQRPNGWLPECCLSDTSAPLLHTLAYSMEGLVGIGMLTNRDDLIAGAQRLADQQIRIMGSDGFIPGRQREDFSAAVDWCCLTGSAQTSIVWSDLYAVTGDAKYRESVHLVNRYLMARHDIRNPDPTLRGGVPGAWPVWGDYGRLAILNWATKFFVDSLFREQQMQKSARA